MGIINGEGRFILLDKPVAHPFSDIVTGTPEGPVFDLSVDLEYYSGVAYLKAEHVEEMAHTIGMITKEEADNLRAQITQLEAEKNSLPPHVESLVHGIGAVLDIYHHATSPGILVPVYLQDPDPGNEDGKGNAGEPDSADFGKSDAIGSDSPAGKDSKPSVGKGPAKLSGGTSDGFEF